jgi:hypothetical protein
VVSNAGVGDSPLPWLLQQVQSPELRRLPAARSPSLGLLRDAIEQPVSWSLSAGSPVGRPGAATRRSSASGLRSRAAAPEQGQPPPLSTGCLRREYLNFARSPCDQFDRSSHRLASRALVRERPIRSQDYGPDFSIASPTLDSCAYASHGVGVPALSPTSQSGSRSAAKSESGLWQIGSLLSQPAKRRAAPSQSASALAALATKRPVGAIGSAAWRSGTLLGRAPCEPNVEAPCPIVIRCLDDRRVAPGLLGPAGCTHALPEELGADPGIGIGSNGEGARVATARRDTASIGSPAGAGRE